MPHDFVNRRQYLHARAALTRLLELGCVPIVNENDAIADDEIRFGDNDRHGRARRPPRSAADVLVLLTDIVGLHTATPVATRRRRSIERVAADDPMLEAQWRAAPAPAAAAGGWRRS